MASLSANAALIPGSTTSWKSPSVQVFEKYQRLQTVGYHAGFTKSPVWPQNVHELSVHKAAWQQYLAEQVRTKLEATLAAHERKMERAKMWEPPEEVKQRTGWRRKKSKKSMEVQIDIVACMEKLKKDLTEDVETLDDEEIVDWKDRVAAVLKEFMERVEIEEIKNNHTENGRSKVLGIETKIWKGNEEALPEGQRVIIWDESRAYWPGHAEFKAEGDERVKNKRFPRRLPLPKLDMLSKERCAHHFKQLRGSDPRVEFRVICEMVKLTGHDIPPEHQATVEYEGMIDGLESVALEYARDCEEKHKEKEVAELARTLAASKALSHRSMPLAIQYTDPHGNSYQEASHTPNTNAHQTTGYNQHRTSGRGAYRDNVQYVVGEADSSSHDPYAQPNYGLGHARYGSNTQHTEMNSNIYPKETGKVLAGIAYTGLEPQYYDHKTYNDGQNQGIAGYASQYNDHMGVAQYFSNAPILPQKTAKDFLLQPDTETDEKGEKALGTADIETGGQFTALQEVAMGEKELRDLVGWGEVFDGLDN